MKTRTILSTLFAVACLGTTTSHAAFHAMQIEQIIGGVDGNTSAQAIQLRLKSAGHNIVGNSSLWAWDAAGLNRVLLLNIASNVTVSSAGARILLTTTAFNAAMQNGVPSFTSDFTLASPIPAAYLTAGRLTFEADGGTVATAGIIYWSLSWGGAAYTGSQTGDTFNDADGNFGPAFGSALTTNARSGIRFTGAATANSTTNAADYAVTTNPATVTKNNGTANTVVPEPASAGMLLLGATLGGLIIRRRRKS